MNNYTRNNPHPLLIEFTDEETNSYQCQHALLNVDMNVGLNGISLYQFIFGHLSPNTKLLQVRRHLLGRI